MVPLNGSVNHVPGERPGDEHADRLMHLADDYEILGEIGRGATGIVYRALDRRRNVPVALKTLSWIDAASLYRLKQEFRTLADVSHPNLVSLYELRADDQSLFFTMELVDGADFRTYATSTIRQDASQPNEISAGAIARLRDALRQLAEGVHALHAAGKLHRDLKPSNVLVTRGGRVVILDFGLATELDVTGKRMTWTAEIAGTISYMAPEQGRGERVTAASDWYSVGVMLYEALTGELPFRGPPQRILQDKQDLDPVTPRERVPSVPADLDALCMDLLRRDPARRPDGDAILARLASAAATRGAAVAPPPAAHDSGFVGRHSQLAALRQAFADVQQGRTVVVHVHGRSGVGKSALVQRFLGDLAGGEREHVLILAGRCYEHESVPYKALDTLIDALSRHLSQLPLEDAEPLLPREVHSLARVFPVLRRAEAIARIPARQVEIPDLRELRRRASLALRELLGRLARRQPVVLFVDDLQWGDVDSGALLAELLRPPDAPRLLLVGCYRSHHGAPSPFLAAFLKAREELGAAGGSRDIELEPLSTTEARELALAVLGRDDSRAHEHADTVARESGGNPFFVHELVQQVRTGVTSAHIGLEHALWTRIAGLSADGRRLLDVIAVAGRPIREVAACRAADVKGDERSTLGALRTARLIQTHRGPAADDEIEPYHDRVREAIEAHLSPAELRACHLRLAHVLETGYDVDQEMLAVHFQGGGELRAASRCYARAAAHAAEALAFEHAAELYRLAIDLGPADREELRELRTRRGDALVNAGRGAEAAREYLAAAADAQPTTRLDLLRLATYQLLTSGRVDQGLPLLRTILDAVDIRLAKTPLRAFVSLLYHRALLLLRGLGFRERDAGQIPATDLLRLDIGWAAALGLSMNDNTRAADIQTRHLLLALDIGEPARIARALALEVPHTACAGGRARQRAARLSRLAEDIANRLGQPYLLALLPSTRGVAEYVNEQWASAVELCDKAEQIFRERCTGVSFEVATCHTFALWGLGQMGEFAELARRSVTLLREARGRGDLYAQTNLLGFTPLARLMEDNSAAALDDIQQALGQWSHQGYHIQHYAMLQPQVAVELYRGNAAATLDLLEQQSSAFNHSFLRRVQTFRVHVKQLHAYSLLGAARAQRDGARRGIGRDFLHRAEVLGRRLHRERTPWARATSAYVRAAAAATRDDDASAVALLRESLRGFEANAMHLFAAAVRRRLGEVIGGDEGATYVAEAIEWMNRQNIRNPARMTAVYAPGW